jgi:hypothetical protein
MTWDQISAAAQVIGVIGGIISVVFLVFEIRRNSRAIEGSTVQALMAMEQDLFTYLADHSGLYVRGCADPSTLSDSESFSFNRYVGAYMSLYYAAFKQFEQGLIDGEVWTAYRNSMKSNFEKPGFAACWATFQLHYPKSFRAEIATH